MTAFVKRTFALLTVICFLALPLALAAQQANTSALKDACTLLTIAEVQSGLGKPVKAGPVKAQNTPGTAECSYIVGDYGSFGVLIKTRSAYETPERTRDEFAKRKMNPVDLPGVGDKSFFISPGYGMVQLNTFKGSYYILMTMLIPGATEAAQRTAAEKLMRTLLTRI